MRKPVIGVLSVVALLLLAPVAHAAFPGLNGKIAFYSGNGTSGGDDIFVMEPNGSGQTAITGAPKNERDPAWSPDGTKIAFEIDSEIFVMNADGSGVVNLTPDTLGRDFDPAWSPDGSQIAFISTRSAALGQKVYRMSADGTDVTPVTGGSSFDTEPAWSPDGEHIAFVRGERIFTVELDGGATAPVTAAGISAGAPNWSPTGARIAYEVFGSSPATTGIHTIESDGSDDVDLSGELTEAHDPAWSPLGSTIAVSRVGHIWTMNADGSGTPQQITTTFGTNGTPDWQPLPFPGYPRPRAATPLRASLVVAYDECTDPDRMHAPPLEHPSCDASGGAANASDLLTVGTPDASGTTARLVGFARLRVLQGDPETATDEADVALLFNANDVRCKTTTGGTDVCTLPNAAGGSDYAGELRGEFDLRITDRDNVATPGGPGPGTVGDTTVSFTVACVPTPETNPNRGSDCSLSTTLDALVPGIVKERQRSIWELDQITVWDGGEDGDADTPSGDTPFLRQGIFVP